MILRYKSRGSKVKELQERLNELGFDAGTPDGIFGRGTEKAVMAFQKSVGLDDDGEVGNMTWRALEKVEITVYDYINADYVTDYYLSDGEYYKEVYKKDAIFLHHTAGAARPDYVIAGWERDKSSRGGALRVGTAFVIGRKTGGAKEFDGLVYRAFKAKHWAHHLGTRRSKYKMSNTKLNQKSIGIEICSFGPLKREVVEGEEKFFVQLSATRRIDIPNDDVCKLDKPWRGELYFQKYTTAQLASTKRLLLDLVKLFEVKVDNRVYDRDWFDMKWDSLNGGGGLMTHCHVREDKTDCFPQPELIDMLNEFNAEAHKAI
jgi:N-acetyl-anhydromuramyl-L-alanine amidase AmpD